MVSLVPRPVWLHKRFGHTRDFPSCNRKSRGPGNEAIVWYLAANLGGHFSHIITVEKALFLKRKLYLEPRVLVNEYCLQVPLQLVPVDHVVAMYLYYLCSTALWKQESLFSKACFGS